MRHSRGKLSASTVVIQPIPDSPLHTGGASIQSSAQIGEQKVHGGIEA